MKPYPRSRVTGEKVREVVARTLLEDVKDPRVVLVTVTGVAMSPDLRHAQVFVVTHGGAEESRQALAGLESAKGRIRTAVGQAIRMRYVPELHFLLDPSLDESIRIAQIIREERAAGRVSEEDTAAQDDVEEPRGDA